VDTGSHPEAGEGYWPAPLYETFEHRDAADHPLPADLERAGYALDDVDAVVQTHLHVDHAGGLHNFAGTDVPVYVHKEELKFACLATLQGCWDSWSTSTRRRSSSGATSPNSRSTTRRSAPWGPASCATGRPGRRASGR